jgi:hypothetical protein
MVNFQVLIHHLPAKIKENHEKYVRLVETISDLE